MAKWIWPVPMLPLFSFFLLSQGLKFAATNSDCCVDHKLLAEVERILTKAMSMGRRAA
jgi:hypothetical protein